MRRQGRELAKHLHLVEDGLMIDDHAVTDLDVAAEAKVQTVPRCRDLARR